MKISIAQLKPVKGNISANIDKHKKLIELAVSGNASAIFFPELSLTSYEPELAKDLAINIDDSRLDCFQEISDNHQITIGLGIPLKTITGVLISMVIFQPQKPRLIYSKQQLHADELPYFENGDKQLILTINNQKIAPAICYESLQVDHSENAIRLGAGIYIASVAKAQKGMEKGLVHYPAVAQKFSIPVLMANCVGYCDNFESVGKSAVWTKQGNLAEQLNDNQEGVLIFDTITEKVTIEVLP